jgi:hypothetical protein
MDPRDPQGAAGAPPVRRTFDCDLVRYVNLKLQALGEPVSAATAEPEFMEIAGPLLRNHFEKDALLGWPQSPVDARVQAFLDGWLADVCPGGAPRIPARTFQLDRPGLARVLSLPATTDTFQSPWLTSYRTQQGVLHNPASDRRTTEGVFHVAEGGLPIPGDKLAVPKRTFAALLAKALQPPPETLVVPFTAGQRDPARLWVTLLLRPLVCPATDRDPARRMEVRFLAPGTLVSNLDFVESIFGNGGDPYLPENDAALDVLGWSGHTGFVLLAPHLAGIRAKDVGLPRWEDATERQRRDGMAWRKDDDRYNGGRAFKVTARDASGRVVTIIADNYYGYCKKEVKTQISFAANLFGNCQEEHAGGAIAHPSWVVGQDLWADDAYRGDARLEDALRLLGDRAVRLEDGHAVDRDDPALHYVPEDAEFHVRDGVVAWTHGGRRREVTLSADGIYLLPNGDRVRLEKQPGGGTWRLVRTRGAGVLCHKPCTVSGGGKSEISKSLLPMIQRAPIYVKNVSADLDRVEEILARDFSSAYRSQPAGERERRPILSPHRSLGSVIKLFTPGPDYTDAHNAWLRELPQTIRQLVFVVKRYHRPEWGDRWREHFSVDRIDGWPGHELKFDGQKLVANYLRVGFDPADGAWRVFKLRPDFNPAEKVQVEDDITVSTVLPHARIRGPAEPARDGSGRIVVNVENRLFQRPDDAVHRGLDPTAEADLAAPGVFVSNFEPLGRAQVREILAKVVDADRYTAPMKRLLHEFVERPAADWVVSSSHPRVVDGKPTKNPRYLQERPDRVNARATRASELGERLARRIPADRPIFRPVDAVLAGRRTNPPQPEIGLPPLAVYGPVHWQELPELFMDFLSSLTGKSPSTTGFGTEGALTKKPFNALWPVVDMNDALVAMILTGEAGFTSAAGHVGPRFRVDHDVSMLVPEVWCRMQPQERDPAWLAERGYLERLEDFDHGGRRVLASRLGWRITRRFVDHFLGRIFENPGAVFPDEMLRPELQGLDDFAAGVDAIVHAQTEVARGYFEDGSAEAACPPLKALLHVMVHGQFEGMKADDPRFRRLFTREALLASDAYRERLRTKQQRDLALWRRHAEALERVAASGRPPADLEARRAAVSAQLDRIVSGTYLDELVGTTGADPFHRQV